MTPDHILDWVAQFEIADREFILDELLHLLPQTYLSRDNCKNLLRSYIVHWTKQFKYADVAAFIVETMFLDLQSEQKSQRELLGLLDEILQQEYGCSLAQAGQNIKRYIYLDDVLSTGNTIYRNLNDWLLAASRTDGAKNNFQFIDTNKIKIYVCLLCCHSWGLNNSKFRLMTSVGPRVENCIEYYWFAEVQNNLKDFNQSLNHMLPINDNTPVINQYLNSIDATSNSDRAFRPVNMPSVEKLFSTPASRNRLETLFLVKGIEILSRVGELRVKQIRPLGYTVKSHKTFGLGTLFFTYRNIPNNCPLVFWWGNNNWKPLFVLKNRGAVHI